MTEQEVPEGPDTPTESVPADWVDPDTDDGTATEPEAEGE